MLDAREPADNCTLVIVLREAGQNAPINRRCRVGDSGNFAAFGSFQ
jgi:hypothetical protein